MQPIEPKPAMTRNHDRFEVQADGLGRYTIDVSLPVGYATSGGKFPVILATDGNFLFDYAQAVVHGGNGNAGGWTVASVVVGVGYPEDEGNASYFARRNFDFHGEWDMADPAGQMVRNAFNAMKSAEGKQHLQLRAGGYRRFMEFLRNELLPALAAHYPIDLTGRHTLIGDSSGGHFALRALFDPTSPFARYVCISPPLASVPGAIQRAEAEYAATHKDLDVDVFICCGKEEVSNALNATGGIGSGVIWTAEQFAKRAWPSAHLHWEIMDHEDHVSINSRAVAAGLRSVHRLRPGLHVSELRRAAEEAAARLGVGDLSSLRRSTSE